MWDYMNHYGWGGMGMGIGMLLFWGLLIAVIVVLARALCGSGNCKGREDGKSALDILKERYARGEIGREEYEQKKSDLEN